MRQPNDYGGRIMGHSQGLGTVTAEMVRERARELALMDGRGEEELTEADWAQAKLELLGANTEPQIEQESESETTAQSWDPVPGTPGHQTPSYTPSDDESITEMLVDEGVKEAEHDKRLDANRDELKENQDL